MLLIPKLNLKPNTVAVGFNALHMQMDNSISTHVQQIQGMDDNLEIAHSRNMLQTAKTMQALPRASIRDTCLCHFFTTLSCWMQLIIREISRLDGQTGGQERILQGQSLTQRQFKDASVSYSHLQTPSIIFTPLMVQLESIHWCQTSGYFSRHFVGQESL